MSAPRILVLPGIGDTYWVAVALRAWCERGEIAEPEIWTWDFGGRRRGQDFVRRLPFGTAGGYFEHDNNVPEFQESYMRDARSVFPGLLGFDYYISLNGALRNGRTISQALGVTALDWYLDLDQTLDELGAARQFESWRPYILAHLSGFGMFENWTRCWNAITCAQLLRHVERESGVQVMLTGSEWDAPFAREVARISGCTDLVGRTDADQFYALFRGAAGCIGWPGGNTVLATAFRVPTLIVWSQYFRDSRFYRNACAPDAPYEIAVVERDTPDDVARRFVELLSHA